MFAARFTFTSTPDEQFYGMGQQACCQDHSVNKKGQVVDLINFDSHVTIPVYMSNKVSISRATYANDVFLDLYYALGLSAVFQHAQSRTIR